MRRALAALAELLGPVLLVVPWGADCRVLTDAVASGVRALAERQYPALQGRPWLHLPARALTHATWLHHVGQEFGFDIVHQVGLRSGDRHEWDTARHKTAWSSTDLSMPMSVTST